MNESYRIKLKLLKCDIKPNQIGKYRLTPLLCQNIMHLSAQNSDNICSFDRTSIVVRDWSIRFAVKWWHFTWNAESVQIHYVSGTRYSQSSILGENVLFDRMHDERIIYVLVICRFAIYFAWNFLFFLRKKIKVTRR